jgi:hypothetical protein
MWKMKMCNGQIVKYWGPTLFIRFLNVWNGKKCPHSHVYNTYFTSWSRLFRYQCRTLTPLLLINSLLWMSWRKLQLVRMCCKSLFGALEMGVSPFLANKNPNRTYVSSGNGIFPSLTSACTFLFLILFYRSECNPLYALDPVDTQCTKGLAQLLDHKIYHIFTSR